MNKKWQIYETDENKVEEIAEKYNLNKLLATILVNRNIVKEEDIRLFLEPTRADFHNPFKMIDMKKAVERIKQAIKNQEKVTIYGDYNDLDFLYESIYYLIDGDPSSDEEYTMQNHLYGFLYDVRHAYQGDREAVLVDNYLQDFKRKWLEIRKKDVTEHNVYFCFNYLLPDIFLDMVLIKYFIRKVDKKVNDVYNPYINMVNYFYSLVLHSIENILTEIKFNKIKKGLLESVVTDSIFIPQWFENISIDYSKMTKKQREKEFMHIMDAIYSYGDYEDYLKMKIDVEKLCKEKNCSLDDLHYEDYPEEIEW